MSTRETLVPVLTKYFEDDLGLAARNLESLPEEKAAEIIHSLPITTSADVFYRFQPAFAAKVVPFLQPDRLRQIIQKMDPEHGTSIFLSLPRDVRQQYVESLPQKFKAQMQELLTFPEDSAGRMMSPDFLAFQEGMLVKDAIQKIRLLVKKKTSIAYVYVIDQEHHLVGVVNMRELLLASSNEVLKNVMQKNVYCVNAFDPKEQVAEELSRRKYMSVPVINAQNRLLGVVNAKNLIQGVVQEATEDIQKMFGAGGDERAFSPVGYTLKKRLPWLHVNLVTAFMAAAVVAMFEDIIAKITVLAVYLPVVAGQGGNAGAQSLAVVMRGLVMREIPMKDGKKLILKETWVGLINGAIIGVVTAGIAWLWQGNPYLGVVIGLGMLVNLAIAGFSGAAIPIIMKQIGLDPAQCSNIILTTITDVMGFLSFLGFAVLFQQYLI